MKSSVTPLRMLPFLFCLSVVIVAPERTEGVVVGVDS